MICKMSLNLSRGNALKYATSNRLASYMGNGILTFIDKKTQLNHFLNNDEVVFYENVDDLSNKLNYFKNNDYLRKKYAKKGKEKYFRYFNSTIVSDYIISKSFDIDIKKKLKWM